jgi:hypothetical protein
MSFSGGSTTLQQYAVTQLLRLEAEELALMAVQQPAWRYNAGSLMLIQAAKRRWARILLEFPNAASVNLEANPEALPPLVEVDHGCDCGTCESCNFLAAEASHEAGES